MQRPARPAFGRFGCAQALITTPMGGALQKLLTLMGAGGLSGGRHYSWISMDDQIYATYHSDDDPDCGVYN